MKILTDVRSLKGIRKPVVLAAGFFDGVHRGHQKVIRRTIACASALGGEAWVLTFDAHPLTVLAPSRAPPLLTSTAHKLEILRSLGIDGCLVVPFTRRLAGTDPRAFMRHLLNCVPALAAILVGRNWRFGRGGEGDARLLTQLGTKMGFSVEVVDPMALCGRPVSSTRIRSAILRGDLREVAGMLGRPFSILGTVVRGRSVGRRLGYPTANLRPHGEMLPPHGVYAVRARLGRQIRDGVLNFGVRPTWGESAPDPTLELHLLDCRRNLYGREIEVFFFFRLREERAFKSEQMLRSQIAKDVEAARRRLAKKSAKNLFTPVFHEAILSPIKGRTKLKQSGNPQAV